jgi:hypothetical protein
VLVGGLNTLVETRNTALLAEDAQVVEANIRVKRENEWMAGRLEMETAWLEVERKLAERKKAPEEEN